MRRPRPAGFRIWHCIVALSIGASLLAFPARAEQSAPANQVLQEVQGVATPGLSTFDIIDADIRDVLRSLADLGDINVLMDPAVKGPVTLKLKHGLSIKEAIELISQTNGYSYRWMNDSRTVIIGDEKSFSNFEVSQTKVYQLHYAQADQLADALKGLVPKDKLGIDLRTNQVTVKASVLELQNVEEVINRLDRQMPQINIEARIEEVTQSASKDLGLGYTFGSGGSFSYPNLLDFKITTTATLSALEQQNKARMLAQPNISTTDSHEGKIFIGNKYPVITSKANSNGGTDVTVTYLEFGTSLTVTPRINEKGIVTVSINAFVSSATDWKTASDGSQIPVITTREASSVVRLKDGETFVLSGLNMKKSSLGTSEVPGLAKIPLLGNLFRSKSDKMYDDSEICIFLTPKISGGDFQANKPAAVSQNQSSKTEPQGTKPSPVQQNAEPAVSTGPSNPAPAQSKPSAQTQQGATTTPKADNAAQNATTDIALKTESSASTTTVTSASGNSGVNQATAAASIADQQPTQPADQTQAQVELQPQPGTTAPAVEVQDNAASDATGTTVSVQEPDINQQPAQPEPGMRLTIHVRRGEGLTGIARRYGIDPAVLASENHLAPNAGLQINQRLVVPIPSDHLYQVKPNETLWRIAKRYGIPLETLQKLNGIQDIKKVAVGRTLILPVAVDHIVDKSV